jgi:hypothetical protein
MISVVVALAAAPAFAGGATQHFAARVKGDTDATLKFSLRFDPNGKPEKLSRVAYENVDLVCPDGSTTEITGSMRGGRVRSTRDGAPVLGAGGHNGRTVKVFSGTLTRSGRAHGVIGIWGMNGPDDCATGEGYGAHTEVRWTTALYHP